MEDWHRMTAVELGRAIGAGRIDPRALADAFLEAAEADPLGPRIYARLTPERARAEARAAADRARAGRRQSLLDGVPISWKDLFDTAGTATEGGTALLRGRVPDSDAAVLRRASAAGLVCLGKTHMTELAFSGIGLNPVTATPPCVNDPEAAPGGSSSGAAASVAFGLAAAAIGSDTGGSARLPPAWNDLVGLKPTVGRLPMQGVLPLCARFDAPGPITRSVEDAAHLYAVMAGMTPPDLGTAEVRGRRFLDLQTVAAEALEEAPRAAHAAALDRLADAGAIVEPVDCPAVSEALELSAILFATEAYGTWKDVIEAEPNAMFPEVRERFRRGTGFSGADYVAAWQQLDRLRRDFAAAVSGCDAVLLPSCPILPPNLERLKSDSDYFVTRNLLALRNTRIANLMGLCAVTLPTGRPSCGLMLMAPPRREIRLLRRAAEVERALAEKPQATCPARHFLDP